MDDLEGEITVLTFNNGPATVIAGTHDRPDERMFVPMAFGGTDPRDALRVAYQKLADSQSRNRICLILTDGQWSYMSGETNISAMNQAGIVTAVALLGDYAGEDLHGCSIGAKIDNPTELATLFRRIALEQMRSYR
jgi:hypothetical protein